MKQATTASSAMGGVKDYRPSIVQNTCLLMFFCALKCTNLVDCNLKFQGILIVFWLHSNEQPEPSKQRGRRQKENIRKIPNMDSTNQQISD